MTDLELTPEEMADCEAHAERLRVWVESDEGGEAIRRASKRSADARARRKKAARIPWQSLHEPVTI